MLRLYECRFFLRVPIFITIYFKNVLNWLLQITIELNKTKMWILAICIYVNWNKWQIMWKINVNIFAWDTNMRCFPPSTLLHYPWEAFVFLFCLCLIWCPCPISVLFCQTGAVVWNRCMILYYRQQNIHTLCTMSYTYISGMNKCRQYEVSKSNQILIIRHLITVWSLRRGCRFGNNFLFFCGTFCHCQVLHTQTHARTDTHTHATHTHTHTHAEWYGAKNTDCFLVFLLYSSKKDQMAKNTLRLAPLLLCSPFSLMIFS